MSILLSQQGLRHNQGGRRIYRSFAQTESNSVASSLRDRFLESLREQQAESRRQREEQQIQNAMIERQLVQQKAESQEQKAMIGRQLAQQHEIIKLLKEFKSK